MLSADKILLPLRVWARTCTQLLLFNAIEIVAKRDSLSSRLPRGCCCRRRARRRERADVADGEERAARTVECFLRHRLASKSHSGEYVNPQMTISPPSSPSSFILARKSEMAGKSVQSMWKTGLNKQER